jgi:putative transposase
MAKNRTKRASKELGGVRDAALVRPLRLGEVLVDTREALLDLFHRAGYEAITKLLKEDQEALCGPRHAQWPGREHHRHSSEPSSLVLGGRRVAVRKPRVRRIDGSEVSLPSWERYSREDPLDERAVEQMVVGVSTRKYARGLEPLPPGLESHGVSRSSVSRRFVARTEAFVREYVERPLNDLDVPIVMIDGKGLGDHLMIVVLGVDREGQKHVLAVREGSTEAHGVCQELLRDLIERGLPVERARLFVIDGGKGIRSAIREVFGEWAFVQRCQVHKMRNVLDHLPQSKRPFFGGLLRRAWQARTADEARRQINVLLRRLDVDHPGAAASLREGLDETLTLLRLGVEGALYRTLRSTNVIENLQGSIGDLTRRVKRWRSGAMALRWTVTALIEAAKRFRRIRGHNNIAVLDASFTRHLDLVRQAA